MMISRIEHEEVNKLTVILTCTQAHTTSSPNFIASQPTNQFIPRKLACFTHKTMFTSSLAINHCQLQATYSCVSILTLSGTAVTQPYTYLTL